MTQRELFTTAMKQGLSLPTELSTEEILSRRRGAYVRTNAARYIAAAVLAAAVFAIGLTFILSRSRIDTAEELPLSGAESQVTELKPQGNMTVMSEDTKRGINTLLLDMRNSAWSYCVSLTVRTDEGRDGNAVTSYRQGITADPAAIARYFSGIELNEVSAAEAEPLFEREGRECIFVAGLLDSVTYGSLSYLCKEGEVWALFVLPDESSPLGSAAHYFKAGPSDPPCFENGIADVNIGGWVRNITYAKIRQIHSTGQSSTVTVNDAEDRIAVTATLDQSGSLPQVSIDSISLPGGVRLTDSRVSLSAMTVDSGGETDWAYNSEGYELKEGVLTMTGDASEDIITAVRLFILFCTDEHDASDDNLYPYEMEIYFDL